jgi:DNA-binding transcriptional regulator LsrR (DeoR family)
MASTGGSLMSNSIAQTASPPVAEMYECYEQGASLAEVAQRFEVSASHVESLFHQAGMRIRSRSEAMTVRGTAVPVGEMYEYYKQGATLSEVAKRYGYSTAHVSRLFKARGFAVRPR